MPELISAKQLRERLQEAVGASETGNAAARHDEVLYR